MQRLALVLFLLGSTPVLAAPATEYVGKPLGAVKELKIRGGHHLSGKRAIQVFASKDKEYFFLVSPDSKILDGLVFPSKQDPNWMSLECLHKGQPVLAQITVAKAKGAPPQVKQAWEAAGEKFRAVEAKWVACEPFN